jgi:hypothetical protein
MDRQRELWERKFAVVDEYLAEQRAEREQVQQRDDTDAR